MGEGSQSQENMAERGVNEGIVFASFLFFLSMTIANKKTWSGKTLHICKNSATFVVVMNNDIIHCQRRNWIGLKGLNVWRGVVVVLGRAYAAFLRNRLQDIKITGNSSGKINQIFKI